MREIYKSETIITEILYCLAVVQLYVRTKRNQFIIIPQSLASDLFYPYDPVYIIRARLAAVSSPRARSS